MKNMIKEATVRGPVAMGRHRIAGLVSLGIVLWTVAIACSKGSSSSNSTTPPAPNSVSIVNMSFSPNSISVTSGTTVTWTNNDNMTHTVKADDGSFDSGNLGSGKSFSHTFTSAGSVTYHCSIHPSMTGKVVAQ